ncbi:TfoX/Sxy family protein [Spongiibacter sp.]|uniref:TfoX/Sxy family protein n=1 Tax=Spongiibacter sp. TaxID=2024860 RepID=UPI0035684473
MDESIRYLLEQLRPLAGLTARRMFGGYGLFCEGLMFALVADQQLYFKVDEQSVAAYRQRGLPAFRYLRRGVWVSLSYHLAPEELIDEPGALLPWAEAAVAAARRARGV